MNLDVVSDINKIDEYSKKLFELSGEIICKDFKIIELQMELEIQKRLNNFLRNYHVF